MNHRHVTRGLTAALALLAGGCAGVQDTVLPAQITYACAGDRMMRVSRTPDARSAAVEVEGRQWALTRAGSAAQEKYTSGSVTLYLDGERAMLEENGRVLLGPCATGPLPTAERYRY